MNDFNIMNRLHFKQHFYILLYTIACKNDIYYFMYFHLLFPLFNRNKIACQLVSMPIAYCILNDYMHVYICTYIYIYIYTLTKLAYLSNLTFLQFYGLLN